MADVTDALLIPIAAVLILPAAGAIALWCLFKATDLIAQAAHYRSYRRQHPATGRARTWKYIRRG